MPVWYGQSAGEGNRVRKIQNGIQTRYVNDVALPLVEVLMETDGVGNPQAVYTYGNGLISVNRSGVNAYYHYDGLGSVRQLTDAFGQRMVSYMYDGFGNVRAVSGTADNPYGFTGESQLTEADNLIFLRARYYDLRTGRFISRDPLLLPEFPVFKGISGKTIVWYNRLSPDFLNAYIYCINNPIKWVDPSGLIHYTAEELCRLFVFNPCMKAMEGSPAAFKICSEAEATCWTAVVFEHATACEAIQKGKDYFNGPGGVNDDIFLLILLSGSTIYVTFRIYAKIKCGYGSA